jgi:hypothetical protein
MSDAGAMAVQWNSGPAKTAKVILMHARNIRSLTALAVVGLCGWPVWQGVNVIRYEMAGPEPEALRPWVAVPGLASAVREYSMTLVDDSSDDKTIRARRDELTEMLAIRPLSSRFWMYLADSRIDAHEDPAKAIDALKLSAVTGPNEGDMITLRGLFGIAQWETLPPEIRKRAIADLATRQISDAQLAWLRKTLAEKTAQVRQEIQLALQAQGFSETNLARIGM